MIQYCQESHYEDQLINGVELKLKELRGLQANPQLVSFLKETQELVFFISSSLVLYNTHKKTYHHLMNVKGEVLFLKTRVDKMNNREYLIWV